MLQVGQLEKAEAMMPFSGITLAQTCAHIGVTQMDAPEHWRDMKAEASRARLMLL
jgi:hypothetical protein